MSEDTDSDKAEETNTDVDNEGDITPLEEPDPEGLIDSLVENGFFFRVGQPIVVVLDGGSSGNINEVARRNGYTIQDVKPTNGAVSTKVFLAPKQIVREKADEMERVHRGAMKSVNMGDIQPMD